MRCTTGWFRARPRRPWHRTSRARPRPPGRPHRAPASSCPCAPRPPSGRAKAPPTPGSRSAPSRSTSRSGATRSGWRPRTRSRPASRTATRWSWPRPTARSSCRRSRSRASIRGRSRSRSATGAGTRGRSARAWAWGPRRSFPPRGSAVGATVTPLGATLPVHRTQHHFEEMGRDILRTVPAEDLLIPEDPPPPSFYPPYSDEPHAWAMVVGLDLGTGCNACVMACQSENNVPVVGPEEVARGRIMHWTRVDAHEQEDGRTAFQPVPCMHCEQATCEPVCPVAASVHDAQGLDLQVNNRCVFMRFRQANCPYTVRRFNVFDHAGGEAYANPGADLLASPRNLNVSVRARGVTEKCTYCVQRIQSAHIDATRGARARPRRGPHRPPERMPSRGHRLRRPQPPGGGRLGREARPAPLRAAGGARHPPAHELPSAGRGPRRGGVTVPAAPPGCAGGPRRPTARRRARATCRWARRRPPSRRTSPTPCFSAASATRGGSPSGPRPRRRS